METKEAIKKRRSIRKFKSNDVPDEVVNEIIGQAVSYSPSAKNLQPWKFLVIKDEEQKAKIASLCKGKSFIASAPILVVVLANEEECYQTNAGYMRSDLIDSSAAMMILMLAATDAGLATCWIGAFEGDKMNAMLGISAPWRVVALTPLGYAAEEGTYFTRKPFGEVVEWRK